MAKETKNASVAFYCKRYKELKTLVAGRKICFSNHQYTSSEPVVIAALDKIDDIERYDEFLKKSTVKVNATVMARLEEEVKEELKKDLKEEVKLELEAELREDIEAELKAKLKIK